MARPPSWERVKLQQLQALEDAERGRQRGYSLRYRTAIDLLAEVAYNGATPKRSLDAALSDEPVTGGIPRYSSGHAESHPPTYSAPALRLLKAELAWQDKQAEFITSAIARWVDHEKRDDPEQSR